MSEKYVPKAIFYDAERLARDVTMPKHLPDEYQYVRLFLLSYSQSKDTYNTYRREVERFCQWVWCVNKTTIIEIDRHSLAAYVKFFQSPPVQWIADKNRPRFIEGLEGDSANPDWRPFVLKKGARREVSNSGMKSLIACLSTFFSFLVVEGVIVQNPVQLMTQKKQLVQTIAVKRIKRRLSHTQWDYVISVAEKLADNNPRFERQLYLLTMFYLLGLRISEVSQNERRYKAMNAFYQDANKRWWFEALGKGNKLRDVAVPDAMLQGLERYRLSMGLSPLPDASDSTPLVPKHKGPGGLSARQIRSLISEMFQHAVDALIRDGHQDDANSMKHATVHWLRHTAISDDVMHRPSEHVRDDVGHENIATTSLYIDVLDDKRHSSAKDKPLKPVIED